MEDVGLRAKLQGAAAYVADAQKVQAATAKVGTQVQQTANVATASSNKLIGALKGVGVAMIAAFAAQKVVSGIGDTIKAASDLNETINKAQVVFGNASASVLKFGDSAAQALGQSKDQAVGAAAAFGNLFLTSGLSQQRAADMSIAIVKLASDLASFNNIEPGEALEKVRSGLVGEAEPLRSLGVLLTEEEVSLQAVKMGLAKSTDEVSQAAKVQARYALIMKQTTTAQGDFANTSKGLANAQRILSASWQDIQAQIGGVLLPVVASLTSALATGLPNAFKSVQSAAAGVGAALGPIFESLRGATGAGIAAFAQGFQQLASVIGDFAGRAGPAVLSIISQIGGIILAHSPTILLFQQIWQKLTGDSGAASGALGVVRGALDAVASALERVADPAGIVMTALSDLADIVEASFMTLADIVGPTMQGLWDQMTVGWNQIVPLIQPALENILVLVQTVLTLIGDAWATHGNDILKIVAAIWNEIDSIISMALNIVQTLIMTVLKVIAGDWQGAWEEIGKIPAIVWQGILDTVQNLGQALYSAVKIIVEALRLEDAWYGIRDFVQKVWVDIVNGVKRQLNSAIDVINNFVGGVNGVLAMLRLPTLSFSLGKFSMDEFVAGARPSWFKKENDELLKFNANLDIAKAKTEAVGKAAAQKVQPSQFIMGPMIAGPQQQAAAALGDAATKAGRAAKETFDELKDAIEAAKDAVDQTKDSIDWMKQSVSDLKDVAAAVTDELNKAEEAMRGFASVRLPGMGAAEDEIFELEQQAKRARLAELGVGEAAKESQKETGASFDMLAAQQRELAEGIPVALQKAQWEADQARQAATRQAQQAPPTKTKDEGKETELERINRLIEIKRLEMELAFGPQQRALQKKFDELTGASKEMTFDEAMKGLVDSAGKANYLRDALGEVNTKIGEGEAAIRTQEEVLKAQQEVVDSLTKTLAEQKEHQDAIGKKISEQNVSLGDQATTTALINDSRKIAVDQEDTIESYLIRERDRAQERLDIVNKTNEALTAQAKIPVNTTAGKGRDLSLEGMAEGGDVTQSGMFRVGERGAETVYLPSGARVIPGRAVTNTSNVTRTFQDTYNVFDASRPYDAVDAIRRYQSFQRITRGR